MCIVFDLEFERIIDEVRKYRQLNQDVRERNRKRVNIFTEEQRQAILDKGRKEGRETFLRQIVNTSDRANGNEQCLHY